MRRTNEEFKAELEKRCQAYRRERARKRRTLLSFGACACLCYAVLTFFDPFAANSEAPMAADRNDLKIESIMQDASSDGLMPESDWEYSFGGGAPAEFAAAPMVPETNMSITGDPGAAPQNDAVETMALDISVSTRSAANSWPLSDAHALTVKTYLDNGAWISGETRCLIDSKVFLEGKTYEYSSCCGTFYDGEADIGLTLPEEDRVALNAILREYIALASEIQSTVKISCGDDEITLDDADAAVIMEYLSSNDWIMSAANCLCDYTVSVDGSIYRYHSDCGTVQDDSGHSLQLSEKGQKIFNEIMAKCPMRID